MTTIKSLLAAALLSTVAAVSFAQTPTAPKATSSVSTPARTTATTNSTSKPTHHKKHHKVHHAKKVSATGQTANAKKTS